jgi:dihydroorotate dehydrogenase (NAD+) catalytic subunit
MVGRLSTSFCGIQLRTPLIAVSGVFGLHYADLIPHDMAGVGAVVLKTVTKQARQGNPLPRIAELGGDGMLNSIGLHNPGIEAFIAEHLPRYMKLPVPLIVSVGGDRIDEYVECAVRLSAVAGVAAIELNVSCPNVSHGGLAFGSDPSVLHQLVRDVRRGVGDGVCLIAKLTPNVTDITVPARAAVEAGASAISLINTLRGMAIDIHSRKPELGNKIGGVSGPMIKPVAVYMIWRCFQTLGAAGIPIIGMGGVARFEDAVELMLAGASAVGIGTALFRDPEVFEKCAQGMSEYLERTGESVTDIVGQAVSRTDAPASQLRR